MRTNVVGTAISIVVLVISLVILPTYFRSIETHVVDKDIVMNAGRNFIDKVIDSRKIPEDAVRDLHLALSACNDEYKYRLFRHKKVVTPNTSGGYEVSWLLMEASVDDLFEPGDFIQIEITQSSVGVYQTISSFFIPSSYSPYTFTPMAMVR